MALLRAGACSLGGCIGRVVLSSAVDVYRSCQPLRGKPAVDGHLTYYTCSRLEVNGSRRALRDNSKV